MGFKEALGELADIWGDLPGLLGPDWQPLEPQLLACVARLQDAEDEDARASAARDLLFLVKPYEQVRLRLAPALAINVTRGLNAEPNGGAEGPADTGGWPGAVARLADVAGAGGLESATEGATPVVDHPGHDLPTRYVSTLLVPEGTDMAVARDMPLPTATAHDLLVKIGPYRPDSLLSDVEGRWPDEELPGGDLELVAVLQLEGEAEPHFAAFTLPALGDSFACDCQAGADHSLECVRREWVRFTITTPARSRRWLGELAIYYEAVIVHAQRLNLPVGPRCKGGPQARLLYRLTRSFAELDHLRGRTASMLVSKGRPVLINGANLLERQPVIGESASTGAGRTIRDLLYEEHFYISDGKEVSRYQEYGQSAEELVAGLGQLALGGTEIYEWLFRDTATATRMPGLIRQEAAARQRPAVLQVANAADAGPSAYAIPWSCVYDLPMGSTPSEYRVCPSVYDFGPGGSKGAVPPRCPVDHTGDANILCPFGFWGFSSIIEHPPSADREYPDTVTSETLPLALVMAADQGLDAGLTEKHLEQMKALSKSERAALANPAISHTGDLADALAGEVMDVAYLYCHCGYQKSSRRAASTPSLLFGTHAVGSVDISSWARSDRWPRPHWPSRRPLVILNGCHTVEVTSNMLFTLVDAFTTRAGAAGVLGTEVTIEQGLGGWAMKCFMEGLLGGMTVGEALRSMRWELFRKGNLMGLAYTPYCLSGLRLRPPPF